MGSTVVQAAIEQVRAFYNKHSEIKASHGFDHVQRVHQHTQNALNSLTTRLPPEIAADIELAALLHDVDDRKYFPNTPDGTYPNAEGILQSIGVDQEYRYGRILTMISWVGCSENGNAIPDCIVRSEEYHWLIPRWADRLEAVGARGVVRCYQYTKERQGLLCSPLSPRPVSEEELWTVHATPDRFVAYQERGGSSTDMISHYFDKLLHIARPPPRNIVRNPYLEEMAEKSSSELVEVCLRFGKSGVVDEDYILGLMEKTGS